jgi:pimeloyl-ACP methyl ester carboxylesterase
LVEAQEYIRRDTESEAGYQYFMDSLVETAEGYEMMFSSQAIAANIAQYRDWFDLLTKIECPVMMIRARGGAAVPDADFSRMKALIPDCVAFEVSEPDHNVYLASRDEFYGHMDSFLGRLRD